jgi:hypothetical protein
MNAWRKFCAYGPKDEEETPIASRSYSSLRDDKRVRSYSGKIKDTDRITKKAKKVKKVKNRQLFPSLAEVS